MTAAVSAPRSFLRAVAGLGQRTLSGRVRRSLPYRLLTGGPSPTRIIARPPQILGGDARIAADLYRGRFDFAGVSCDVGARSPFAVAPPSRPWLEHLVGFAWLRHLKADGGAIAAANARASVADWIAIQGRRHDVAWRPELVARRLSAWLGHADMIVSGADQDFFDAFISSIGRQLRYLIAGIDTIALPQARLASRIAIVQAALCLDDCERILGRATRELCAEIDRQILPDGGHRNRNPKTLVELLPDLICLRDTFAETDREAPQALVSAIDRMLPMLRLFLHGDGGLALFNGAGGPLDSDIAAIFATDATRGRPLTQARHSAYQRIVRGGTTVIMDTGAPPPPGYGADAHAGCLSFELSHGRHRIIVNCGDGPADDDTWAEVSRTTAAHSTATVNDSPSGRCRGGWLARRLHGGPALDGPRLVEVDREEGASGTIVEAGHDGYDGRYGVIHSRRLYLAEDGNDLRGEDSFTRTGRRFLMRGGEIDRYAVRFHLHPSVRATASKDGDTILLLLPNHVGWRFTVAGGEVSLEESVYLGDGAPRRSRQIVVQGTIADTAVVKWALKKQVKPAASAAVAETPALPFGD